MQCAINLNSVIPVRANPGETNEMVTQLLFGELFKITETTSKWCRIENQLDGYSGWIDEKMASYLSEEEFKELSQSQSHIVNSPFAKILTETQELIYLSAGSILWQYNDNQNTFSIAGQSFRCVEGEFIQPFNNPYPLVQTAQTFLNVPYLWGGKNILGMDCSGFTQVIFRLHGISLPRDAKDQFKKGISIPFQEIQSGDLAFFKNENDKIIHVGIILNNKQLIHASGKVKIDQLDEKGIYSNDSKKYTHLTAGIKRL